MVPVGLDPPPDPPLPEPFPELLGSVGELPDPPPQAVVMMIITTRTSVRFIIDLVKYQMPSRRHGGRWLTGDGHFKVAQGPRLGRPDCGHRSTRRLSAGRAGAEQSGRASASTVA